MTVCVKALKSSPSSRVTASLTGLTPSATLRSPEGSSSASVADVDRFFFPRLTRRTTRYTDPRTAKSSDTHIASRPCEMNSPTPCLPIRGTSPYNA